MSRQCDAFKCGAVVEAGRFLCSRHWRLVPLPTQRAINTHYRAGRAGFAFLSDPKYLSATVEAISGIATLEGHENGDAIGEASSYGRLLKAAQRKAVTIVAAPPAAKE